MEPIWHALHSKTCAGRWDKQQKGSFKSACAGRQFPQTRVKACGWSTHDRCLVCLHKIVEDEKRHTRGSEAEKKPSLRDKVEATDDQLRRAPVGNLCHSIWTV